MTTSPAKRSHHRKLSADGMPLKRGRPSERVIAIDYDAAPSEQPRTLHQPQRVTWWNVVTGRVEERWE